MRQVSYPLYGRKNPDTAALVSRENPIEMLDAYDVRDGQFNMYIAYAGLDQFNRDAQGTVWLQKTATNEEGDALEFVVHRGKHQRH